MSTVSKKLKSASVVGVCCVIGLLFYRLITNEQPLINFTQLAVGAIVSATLYFVIVSTGSRN